MRNNHFSFIYDCYVIKFTETLYETYKNCFLKSKIEYGNAISIWHIELLTLGKRGFLLHFISLHD